MRMLCVLIVFTQMAFAQEREINCAKNFNEFQANEKLKSVYPSGYNPFGKWNGEFGSAIVPAGDGEVTVKVPLMGRMLGYKDTNLALQVCADGDTKYLTIQAERHEFDDQDGNSFTLADGGRKSQFRRKDD